MKIRTPLRSAMPALGLAAFFAAASGAAACPACYGDTTGDRMGVAAQIGIFAMVAIMLLMLGAIGGFMWYLNWRAKNPLPDYSELLQDEEAPDASTGLTPRPETL